MARADGARDAWRLSPPSTSTSWRPPDSRQRHSIRPITTETDFWDFLRADLSVRRIDDIRKHLWLVGRPYPPRPLNTQRVLEREIIPTTDASLHLVWTTGRLYVKPLPACLLSEDFYEQRLSPRSADSSRIKKPALGLLYSYIALLPSPLDFQQAGHASLLPADYPWPAWTRLVRRVLADYPDILPHVSARYEYGELRLARLDKISRYLRRSWLHGYSPLTGSTRYVDFFRKNIAVIGASTVYLVVVISAMSLGRTTKALKDNDAFDRACYGFAVFAILLPVLGIGLIVAVFLFIFVANYIRTIAAQSRRQGNGCEVEETRGTHEKGSRSDRGMV